MKRNGRRIALSLVAIVLGAGYLMKVIPPETDVGADDGYSISIDGSLVTNPLDINELPHNFSPAVLSLYSVAEQAPQNNIAPKIEETPLASNAEPKPPLLPPIFGTSAHSPQGALDHESPQPDGAFLPGTE